MSLLDQFRITKEFATSGGSRVFWAEHLETNEPCVVKALHTQNMRHWKQLQLLEREAKTLSQIHHPRIPQVRDFLQDGDEVYLFLEAFDAPNLEELVHEQGPFSESEVLLFVAQALSILEVLHAKNPPLIHRDLKLSNFLWNTNKELFLVDFGGVQEVVHAQGSGGSTVVGTYGYMAPEQFSGRAVEATDLYGLGMCVLHLLTGKAPSEFEFKGLDIEFRREVNCSTKLAMWIENMVRPQLSERLKTAQKAFQHIQNTTLEDLQVWRVSPHREQVQSQILEHKLSIERRRELPESIGEYKIIELLAEGVNTLTYGGENIQGKSVVIKALRFENLKDWKQLDLFEREAKTLLQVQHPKIPLFLDVFQKEGEYGKEMYLVESRLQGENLAKKMESGWRPTDTEVISIAEQMLGIIHDLHNRQPLIIHRDIKPSNILFHEGNVFLVDFNSVYLPLLQGGSSGSTIAGTFGYMAPEQLLGKAYRASDIYGLGVTLLVILSGRQPSEIPQEGFRFSFQDVVQVGTDFKEWLGKMVAPKLAERYDSAERALYHLEHIKLAEKTRQQLTLESQEDREKLAKPQRLIPKLQLEKPTLENLRSRWSSFGYPESIDVKTRYIDIFLKPPSQLAHQPIRKKQLQSLINIVFPIVICNFLTVAMLVQLFIDQFIMTQSPDVWAKWQSNFAFSLILGVFLYFYFALPLSMPWYRAMGVLSSAHWKIKEPLDIAITPTHVSIKTPEFDYLWSIKDILKIEFGFFELSSGTLFILMVKHFEDKVSQKTTFVQQVPDAKTVYTFYENFRDSLAYFVENPPIIKYGEFFTLQMSPHII